MKGFARSALLAILGLCLLGGCPLLVPEGGGAGGSSGQSGSGASGSSAFGDTAGGGSSGDALSLRFPGCVAAPAGESWRAEVLALVNAERSSRGLDGLAPNETLASLAEQYACEMIHHDFFAHDNPATGLSGEERLEGWAGEYGYTAMGENLAGGQRSPAEVVQAWMESADHREAILSAVFTEAGVGVRSGGEYQFYWVLEFGRPR